VTAFTDLAPLVLVLAVVGTITGVLIVALLRPGILPFVGSAEGESESEPKSDAGTKATGSRGGADESLRGDRHAASGTAVSPSDDVGGPGTSDEPVASETSVRSSDDPPDGVTPSPETTDSVGVDDRPRVPLVPNKDPDPVTDSESITERSSPTPTAVRDEGEAREDTDERPGDREARDEREDSGERVGRTTPGTDERNSRGGSADPDESVPTGDRADQASEPDDESADAPDADESAGAAAERDVDAGDALTGRGRPAEPDEKRAGELDARADAKDEDGEADHERPVGREEESSDGRADRPSESNDEETADPDRERADRTAEDERAEIRPEDEDGPRRSVSTEWVADDRTFTLPASTVAVSRRHLHIDDVEGAVFSAYRSIRETLVERGDLPSHGTHREFLAACRETFEDDPKLDALERLVMTYEQVCYADGTVVDREEFEELLDLLVDSGGRGADDPDLDSSGGDGTEIEQ
jgi:hypothetical protein